MKGFKTLTFNGLAVILPILEGLDVSNLLNETGMAVYVLIVAIGNAVLRFVTDSPVGKSE